MRGGSCWEIRSGEGRRKTLSQIPGSSLRWRAALGLRAGEGGLGLLYLLLEQSCFLPAIAGECDLLGCIPSLLCQGQPGRSLINRGLLAQPPLLPCPSQRPGRQGPWDTQLAWPDLAVVGAGPQDSRPSTSRWEVQPQTEEHGEVARLPRGGPSRLGPGRIRGIRRISKFSVQESFRVNRAAFAAEMRSR